MPDIYKSSEGARLIRERYLAFLSYWPSPNRPLHVPTSQGDTFVVECGAEGAPPLLLLHGGAMNSSMWIGDVAKWAPHFRIYAVDVIGEPGLSASSRPALRSDVYAAWLDEVMQALSIGRIAIAGISLGGWLALDYATRRPGRVTALALLCPGGIGRQKVGIVFQTLSLRMCGAWGTRKQRERTWDVCPKFLGRGARICRFCRADSRTLPAANGEDASVQRPDAAGAEHAATCGDRWQRRTAGFR